MKAGERPVCIRELKAWRNNLKIHGKIKTTFSIVLVKAKNLLQMQENIYRNNLTNVMKPSKKM